MPRREAGLPDRRTGLTSRDESIVDRRMGLNRRDPSTHSTKGGPSSAGEEPGGSAGAGATGLERRRGVGRRLSDFAKSAEEGELTPEQFLFVTAIDAFKRANNKTFPTWTDVLEVIRLLGYRKTCPSELNIQNAEDWRETADAPANVRTHKAA